MPIFGGRELKRIPPDGFYFLGEVGPKSTGEAGCVEKELEVEQRFRIVVAKVEEGCSKIILTN